MKLHPALRLLIPALILAGLLLMPRRVVPAGSGDGDPSPLVALEEDVPEVPLEELFHEMAGPDARITVVEFSDFGCQYCGKFHRETLPGIRRDYVDTGKVRWRMVPFVLGMFPNGVEAMRAATCVAEQGEDRFWAMHDTLFAQQDTWKATRYADQLFKSYAVIAGAEAEAFTQCYDDVRSSDRVTAANALANKTGVRSTPTFFVNGQLIQGALPERDFRQILEAALSGVARP